MNSKKQLSHFVAVLMLMSGLSILLPICVNAAESDASNVKTKQVPAVRAKVYDQFARAQTLADEDKVGEAILALDNVQAKISSMNSYERAMLWNFYAFIYYQQENYPQALNFFEKVVEEDPIPQPFELTTLFSLSQLHMMQGNFDKTIDYLDRWEKLNTGEIPASNYYLKAQAMYQQKSYAKAEGYISKAIALMEQQPDGVADENWYILQRAVYYELKQPEKVKDVLVKMLKHYDQPQYWTQLAGMYGELGEEKKQLAILESAYQQGYIKSASDIYNLAQLYYYHGAPFKGASLITQAMDEGVLERNLRNLKFLAQSWTLAQENEKAIPVLMAAASLADNGELHAQLGQLHLNLENWTAAIQATEQALEKGELANPGNAYLVLGLALFNQERYKDSIDALALAESYKQSERMAKQWKKYVNTEQQNALLLNGVGS
ncbi:tetratricopeptide repeat protein [Alteromonadaceae bacterium BrNp21-10]|nr:tetratricopeptide repeat protein [Alteromonadaceae bacterium BrNp21-10]